MSTASPRRRLLRLLAAIILLLSGFSVEPTSAQSCRETASEERPVIAIDPGHGGSEPGAVFLGPGGRAVLVEKDVNLAISLFLADDLREAGYEPVLTRISDSAVNVPPSDRNGDGRVDNDDDLQARVDIANQAGARLLISIHNNGSTSARTRGTSTWYASAHPLGSQGQQLARLVQEGLLEGLRAAGYTEVVNQGANDDPPLQKPYGHLFVVGPQTPRVARASQMPGVIGESLYVTSEVESQLLASEPIQRALAAAYLRAVQRFLSESGEGPCPEPRAAH